jgi:hypothetical protein
VFRLVFDWDVAGRHWKMRKSLWIMLAVIVVAISAPYASADTVTLDLSGSLSPGPDAGEACVPSGCTLGGDIVINNTTGTVISVDFTVAGASPSVGPFNQSSGFAPITSEISSLDGATPHTNGLSFFLW